MAGGTRQSGGFDVTQVLCMVLGLLLGAAVIFVAGLQVGERLDPEALSMATAAMQSSQKGEKVVGALKKRSDDYSFFAELEEPVTERRRKLRVPQGNANNPDMPERARRRKMRRLARAKAPKVNRRTLDRRSQRKVRQPAAKVPAALSRKDNLLAASQAAPKARKLSQEPAGSRYTIQVGTYKTLDEATAAMTRLRAKGQIPRISLSQVPGKGKVYRVRIGRFSSKEEAQARLGSGGVSGVITRM